MQKASATDRGRLCLLMRSARLGTTPPATIAPVRRARRRVTPLRPGQMLSGRPGRDHHWDRLGPSDPMVGRSCGMDRPLPLPQPRLPPDARAARHMPCPKALLGNPRGPPPAKTPLLDLPRQAVRAPRVPCTAIVHGRPISPGRIHVTQEYSRIRPESNRARGQFAYSWILGQKKQATGQAGAVLNRRPARSRAGPGTGRSEPSVRRGCRCRRCGRPP